jgi:hypothetical protein
VRERVFLAVGYRLNPVVEEFMLEMHNRHYGVGALTPEVVAAVQKITQDMVYELKSRYSNGAGPLMATLLQKQTWGRRGSSNNNCFFRYTFEVPPSLGSVFE